MAKHELVEMVNSDIILCRSTYKNFSMDKERLKTLFYTVIPKYTQNIEGFSDGIKVISEYDDPAEQGEVLRENIRLIIEKLEAFKRNGYTNVGLKEASLEHSPPPGPILLGREAFMEARRALSGLALKSSEMSEAEGYIDKIEEICFAALSDEQKWETLRPIVFWASGKPMRLAMLILPLFLNVSS